MTTRRDRLHTDRELARISTMAMRLGMNPDLLLLAHCVAAVAHEFTIHRVRPYGVTALAALGAVRFDTRLARLAVHQRDDAFGR